MVVLVVVSVSALLGVGAGAWLVWQHAQRQRAMAAFRKLQRIRQLDEELRRTGQYPQETPWCQFQSDEAQKIEREYQEWRDRAA